VRDNQLVGYGLVVGLAGTGDKAPFTNQTFRNMMNQFGVTLPEGVDPKTGERRCGDGERYHSTVCQARSANRHYRVVYRQRQKACAAASC